MEQLLGRLPESELGDGAPAAAHAAALHRVGGTRGNLQGKHISIVYVVLLNLIKDKERRN